MKNDLIALKNNYVNISKEKEIKTVNCQIWTTSLSFPCSPNIKPCYNFAIRFVRVSWTVIIYIYCLGKF